MNNKIAIRLHQKNGEYSFKEITEIINGENTIEISNTDYNKLVNGDSINIKGENIDTKKDIDLVFNQEELLKEAIKGGASESEAKDAIKRILSTIGSNIETITLEEIEDMVSINISFMKTKEKVEININDIDPDAIIKTITEKVVAQDKTVETVTRNIYNNQLIIESGDEDLINNQKTSILLDGPTGTGKTLIMKEIAKNMNLPIVIKPATMYTSTGYKGVELQEMLVSLLKETDGDLEAAERGIIVLDEFDKLGNGNGDSSLEIRKAVQQDLLTYLSGGKFTIEYKGKSYDFDTSKVTFICLGAFTDLREKKQETLDENGNYIINEQDYIDAGIMREIVGRFQLRTSTKDLNREDLKKILINSSISPLKKLVDLAKNIYHANIVYDDTIIDAIVEHAYEENTGARALTTTVNGIRNIILKDLNNSRKNSEPLTIQITQEMLDLIEKEHEREGRKNEI